MRLHISSTPHDIFRPVESLRGFKDSPVRFRIEQSDLDIIRTYIDSFNIENFADELASDLSELDRGQVALVFAILKHEDILLSPGLITAYALRSNISLSSIGFQNVIDVLVHKGILIAQNDHMVIKYKLQQKILETLYVLEA